MADALHAHRDIIKQENAKDLQTAKSLNLSQALIDRLLLTDARIDDMIAGIRRVAMLPIPSAKSYMNMKKIMVYSLKKFAPPLV